MLDFSHLPPSSKGIQQIFLVGSTNVWFKPRGVSFVHFFLLGGGGGGAAGSVGGNSTPGGGGGASGNQCSLTFPIWMLPDVLYIGVGPGGAGGTAPGGSGAIGSSSFVQIYPSISVANYTLATASGAISTAALGVAGAANAASSVLLSTAPLAGLAFMPRLLLATNMALINQAGSAGGTTGAGAALTLPTTGLVVTGGTGGGGMGTVASSTGSAGGAFTVPAGGVFPPQIGGIAGGALASSGGPGSNGVKIIPNLNYFYGGTGGASAGGTSGTGGLGGAGAYGCGGGGGGAAVTGQVAGNGGRGGDGLVIITAW